MSEQMLRVTLIKSKHGRLKSHQGCLTGLGIRHRNQSVLVRNTAENCGMIAKVAYLLKVEEA